MKSGSQGHFSGSRELPTQYTPHAHQQPLPSPSLTQNVSMRGKASVARPCWARLEEPRRPSDTLQSRALRPSPLSHIKLGGLKGPKALSPTISPQQRGQMPLPLQTQFGLPFCDHSSFQSYSCHPCKPTSMAYIIFKTRSSQCDFPSAQQLSRATPGPGACPGQPRKTLHD